MKKCFAFAIALLMLLTVGCSRITPEDVTLPQPSIVTETTQAPVEPTETTAPPAVETRELLDLDDKIMVISAQEDFCAVLCGQWDALPTLYSISLPDGEILASKEMEESGCSISTNRAGIAVSYYEGEEVTVYTPDLEVRNIWKTPDASGSILTNSGTFCYISNGDAVRLDTVTGEEKRISLASELEGDPSVIMEIFEDSYIVSYFIGEENTRYERLDWDHLTKEPVETILEYPPWDTGHYYQAFGSDQGTWATDTMAEDFYYLPQPGMYSMISTDDRILFNSNEGSMVSCDLRDGSIRSLDQDDSWVAAFCGEDVLYTNNADESLLRYWDCSVTEPELTPAAHYTRAQMEDEIQKMKDGLERQTGIHIFYGEEGASYNDYGDTGYQSEPAENLIQIYRGLEETQSLFEEYPDEIFMEMLPEGVTDFNLYYVKGFLPTSEGNINDAVAFTTSQNGVRQVVLDVTWTHSPLEFRATIVHELMHAMEDRMFNLSEQEGVSYWAFWESYLPADSMLYFYDYTDEDGNTRNDTQYTADSDLPLGEAYFLDGYSRTYPTEDRARILENLYKGKESAYYDELNCGILQKKAQLLCALIRHCYPSCAAAETLPWEKDFETVPYSEFEQQIRDYQPEAVG